MALSPFHLAFPVDDLEAARAFYGGVLGCREGRSSDRWVDFDFFGHQVVAHLDPAGRSAPGTSEVDGHDVPVRHFGLVVAWDELAALEKRLREHGLAWLVPPHVRFRGEAGEQKTMFVQDPSGNALEFKAFRDPDALFRR
jgi:extradiol dioxygenase family protein